MWHRGLSGTELKKLICALHHYNLNVFPKYSDRLVPYHRSLHESGSGTDTW